MCSTGGRLRDHATALFGGKIRIVVATDIALPDSSIQLKVNIYFTYSLFLGGGILYVYKQISHHVTISPFLTLNNLKPQKQLSFPVEVALMNACFAERGPQFI